MPLARLPITGSDANTWSDILNRNITQTNSALNGAFNSFDQFSYRPTNLTADDAGKTYLYTQTGNWHEWSGTEWKVHNKSEINVKDYGAVGDNSGKTPEEQGIDISNENWNNWDNSIFKTNSSYSPFYANNNGTFQPPRSKPFLNTDTWDYIGIMRSLSIGKSVFIPAGDYLINLSQPDRGGYNGLLIMNGQEQNIFGAGRYATKISPKEDYQYFNTNNTTQPNYYSLLTIYRCGGPATTISDINFEGPINYTTSSKNLTLLNLVNVNGLTIKDCWFSGAARGTSWTTNCSDSFIKGITTEYLFDCSVYMDINSDVSIDFCNFWASANNVSGQTGIYSLSKTFVTNSRFIGFGGASVISKGGLFCNNNISAKSNGINLNFGSDTTFTGNYITGSSNSPILRISSDSTVSGNYFNIYGQHSCIDISNGTSASNIIISNNTLIKTDITSTNVDNKIFTSIVDGISYFAAADSSCLVTGNVCKGNFQSTLGAANITKNVVNGSLL